MKSLTQTEIERLLASTSGLLHAMILCGARHGLRNSEICSLKKADVHLSDNTITIRRLKGSLTTTQPMQEDEKLLLAECIRKSLESRYVFADAFGKPIKRLTFYRWFRKACLEAGIAKDKAHPHVLRHSFAMRLVQANVTMAIIQRACGHKNIGSTAIYCMPSDETVGKVLTDVIKGE